jgi:hypothetical protein
MYDILVLFVHLIVTVVRLIKPGSLRAVVAESVLTRHQILILNRSRKRTPSLRVSDRIIAGLCTLLMHPSRVLRCGIVLKPSTLLHFHHVLTCAWPIHKITLQSASGTTRDSASASHTRQGLSATQVR